MSTARYPLTVALPGGRVRHGARTIGTGYLVITLCGKRGEPTGDGAGMTYCSACAKRPNPIDSRSYTPKKETT